MLIQGKRVLVCYPIQAALRLGRLVAFLLTGLANFQSQVDLCRDLVENVALG